MNNENRTERKLYRLKITIPYSLWQTIKNTETLNDLDDIVTNMFLERYRTLRKV